MDELDEVSNQYVSEDSLNNQRVPSGNCVLNELPLLSFPAEHIVDLKFDVLYSIYRGFKKDNTLPIQLRGPALNGM